MLWTAFPDELDTKAVELVLKIFRGEPIVVSGAALTVTNVIGYVEGKVVGPLPMGSSPIMDRADGEVLLASLMEHAKNPDAVMAFDWSKLLQLLLQILPLVFNG